jgi:hypothetical protein
VQERIIKRGLATFIDVGNALATIRAERLYRAKYATFDDYCAQRWGWDRRYASKVIGASQVVTNLSPIGDSLPANEAQARPLAGLPADEQREVWQGVVIAAERDNRPITAARVEAAVREVRPPLKQKRPKRGIPDKTAVINAVSAAVDNFEAKADGYADEEIIAYLGHEERRALERAVTKAAEFAERWGELLTRPIERRYVEEGA